MLQWSSLSDLSPGSARIAVDGRQLPATGHGPAATSREAVLELTVQNFVRSEGRYANAHSRPCILYARSRSCVAVTMVMADSAALTVVPDQRAERCHDGLRSGGG